MLTFILADISSQTQKSRSRILRCRVKYEGVFFRRGLSEGGLSHVWYCNCGYLCLFQQFVNIKDYLKDVVASDCQKAYFLTLVYIFPNIVLFETISLVIKKLLLQTVSQKCFIFKNSQPKLKSSTLPILDRDGLVWLWNAQRINDPKSFLCMVFMAGGASWPCWLAPLMDRTDRPYSEVGLLDSIIISIINFKK